MEVIHDLKPADLQNSHPEASNPEANGRVVDDLRVNDLNLCVATENGSGSASSNMVLYKSIYKLGIPCSGKNLFPSNIQGLPTWYYIRASGRGFLGRKRDVDVVVLFNPATFAEDVGKVRSGGLILYDSSKGALAKELRRNDVHYVGIAAENLVREHIKATQLRAKQRNMVYVGALAALFGIPLQTLRTVLEETFKSKQAVIDANWLCIKAGFEPLHADSEAQTKARRIGRLQAIPGGNREQIMAEGNMACALGAIYGGAAVVTWYPITPSSSLVEAFAERVPALRAANGSGQPYAVVQAEDEIAAATMVVGAGWCGARAMTATAGPGLSLMQEAIGLAYYVEVPSVFFVVQRGGPSTGLPTRTQQADITLMHQGSHGDTRHLVLIPHDNASAFELSWRAFDVAERFQTPVFVMTDLDLGMNTALSAPFAMPPEPFDRGKLLDAEQIAAQADAFSRYLDRDGDGITQRTVPGNRHPAAAYFARGSGHDEQANYSENHEVYRRVLVRLRRKYESAREVLPSPEVDSVAEATLGLISFGSSVEPVREARALLAAPEGDLGRGATDPAPRGTAREAALLSSHLVLRALPPSDVVEAFLAAHQRVFLIEQNRDGQMTQILRDEYPHLAARLRSLCFFDGMPLAATEIAARLRAENALP